MERSSFQTGPGHGPGRASDDCERAAATTQKGADCCQGGYGSGYMGTCYRKLRDGYRRCVHGAKNGHEPVQAAGAGVRGTAACTGLAMPTHWCADNYRYEPRGLNSDTIDRRFMATQKHFL